MAATDLVTLAELKQYLGIPGSDSSQDAALTAWIAAATNAIEAYCERGFVVREYVDEYQIMATRGGRLYLRRYPLVALLRVTDLDSGQDVPVAEVVQRKHPGVLVRAWWPWCEVQYSAGLCADTASVPPDVKAAVGLWVATQRGRQAAGASGGAVGPLASRTMGQVSTSYHAAATMANAAIAGSPTDMPDPVAHLLAPYMSRST